MMAQGLDLAPSPPSNQKDCKTRAMGSRRIFPPVFKLQVLDSYRNDRDCKGNQRATARKYNIHRRQIQKWLQCEASLRSAVADSNSCCPPVPSPERRGPRVFKHDARTLKLVAQKLYPSSFVGGLVKDERATPEYLVSNEYQLNDSQCEGNVLSGHKLTMGGHATSLFLKDHVSGSNLFESERESKAPVENYLGSSRVMEPRSLGAAPMFVPPIRVPRPVCPLHRPMPVRPAVSPSLPSCDEPYNLVKSPAQPVESSTLARSDGGSLESSPAVLPPADAISPIPTRVTEITSEVKTSAFSPKRKWLQESLHDNFVTESVVPFKTVPSQEGPKSKKPCPNFSIERLCGSTTPPIKCESRTPPSQSSSPSVFAPPSQSTSPCVFAPYPPPLVFPPPFILPHRTIPNLLSLHFKPDAPSGEITPEPSIKEEASSEDDEPIDVLSTTPVENKSFEFPGGKRRSFSVQFKLSVLDAFHHDKDCNKNQRATARKFNINRRQVQKWLSQEQDLRSEGFRKTEDELCVNKAQHCTVSVKHCMEQNCFMTELKQSSEKPIYHWLPYAPWCTYDYRPNIY